MSDFQFTPFAAANVKVELEEYDEDDNFNPILHMGMGNCEEKTHLQVEGNISVNVGQVENETTEKDLKSIEETDNKSHKIYIKSEPPEEIIVQPDILVHLDDESEQDDDITHGNSDTIMISKAKARRKRVPNQQPNKQNSNNNDILFPGALNLYPSDKPFNCEICGRTFSLKVYLNKHMLSHSEERPCKCDTCGKSFKNSRYLTKHKRTHGTDKAYPCEICGKVFIRVDNLKQHSRVHLQNEDKVRPQFNCVICGKSYVALKRLNDHMMIHTGEHMSFPCDSCEKGFSNAEALAQHKLCHIDEKDKFKCETCGKSFARSYNFNIHLKLHSGETPFMCDICGKSYVSRNRLTRHQNTTCYTHGHRVASLIMELDETPQESSSELNLPLNFVV